MYPQQIKGALERRCSGLILTEAAFYLQLWKEFAYVMLLPVAELFEPRPTDFSRGTRH
jgi:hypothetical protein